MSYEFYKIMHVSAVLILFTSLGTLAASASASTAGEGARLRRLAKIAHGVALVIIFVAGFGLMARLGMFGEIALWAWAKMGLWLVLGIAVLPLRRRPEWASKLWFVIVGAGGLAAWLAIQKPF
jgi:uncharacterized membrane protein SirB2